MQASPRASRKAQLLRRRTTVAWVALALGAGSMAFAGGALANGSSTTGPYFTAVRLLGPERVEALTASSLVVSSDDTPMVAGSLTGTAYFPTGPGPDDSIALTARAQTDIYVAAFNRDDSYFDWAVKAGGNGPDGVQDMTINTEGAPIITGRFYGTASFPTGPAQDDSITLTSPDYNIYVAAMNSDDSYFAWATRVRAASLNGIVEAVTVTADDTPIIFGYYSETLYFPTGPAQDDSITLAFTGSNAGRPDLFVAALNSDDSYFAWAAKTGGDGDKRANDITVTGDGAPVITGMFQGTASFPTGPAQDDSITLTSPGYSLYVAALNADDSYFSWAVNAGGGGGSRGLSVAVTQDDSVFVGGSLDGTVSFPTGPDQDDSISVTARGQSDAFVASLNADDSYFTWVARVQGVPARSAHVASIASMDDSSLVVTGSFGGTASFPTGPGQDDSISVTAQGQGDAFVAAVNADSPFFTWVVKAGGTGYDGGSSIAVTSEDTPIMAGSIGGTTYFPTGAETFIAVTPPTGMSFAYGDIIAWLGPSSSGPPAPPAPTPPPILTVASAPLGVQGTAGVGSASITWSPSASEGSYPITTYQAIVDPGGSSCLVAAPALTCTVTRLANATEYTARVRALTAAGWSMYSAASPPFTPQVPVTPSITITGTRADVRGASGVVVTGIAVGIVPGEQLQPWVRFPGQRGFTQGSPGIVVGADGTFTWQRRTGKSVHMFVSWGDRGVASNRLLIRR